MSDKIELARMLIAIYKAPRRAYPNGPFLPVTSQDELIVEALEMYEGLELYIQERNQ